MTNHKQQREQEPITVTLSSSEGIPGAAALDRAAQVTIPNARAQSEDEEYIITKGRETLVHVLVKGSIISYVDVVGQALTFRTMQHFSDLDAADQVIRAKPRNTASQRNVEEYNQVMLQLYVNFSANNLKQGLGQLGGLTDTPLTPPEEKKPQMIVEEEPSLLGRLLFGRQKVTKVLR